MALHRHANSVVDILPPEADSTIQAMQVGAAAAARGAARSCAPSDLCRAPARQMTEKPDVRYEDIGGLDMQKQEVREAVELPLSHPELYSQVRGGEGGGGAPGALLAGKGRGGRRGSTQSSTRRWME